MADTTIERYLLPDQRFLIAAPEGIVSRMEKVVPPIVIEMETLVADTNPSVLHAVFVNKTFMKY